jgi:3-keto-5-aminohexanoate cleavage enzyme
MAESGPVIIEAALNGARNPTEHPSIPLTPHDVSTEAARCAEAGAAVVHVHARTIEGAWSFDPDWYAYAIQGIRDAAPDLLISITSFRPEGFAIDMMVETLNLLGSSSRTRPDLISINLGHIAVWDRRARRTEHFPNDLEDVTRLLAACAELGIVPELGIMDFGFISNAVALRDSRSLPERPWFLLELDSPGWGRGPQVAPAIPEIYDALAEALIEQFPGSTWAAHGSGTPTFPILERAIEGGEHVRVGFEDAVTLPDGNTPESNADQVRWAVETAVSLGRRTATPDEARRIIGLTPA